MWSRRREERRRASKGAMCFLKMTEKQDVFSIREFARGPRFGKYIEVFVRPVR